MIFRFLKCMFCNILFLVSLLMITDAIILSLSWEGKISAMSMELTEDLITTLVHSVHFSCSVVSNSLQLHELQQSASLSITNSQSLLKLMSVKSVMPSKHLILCHLLLLLPSIFPNIRVFSSESALFIKWPKYWSFSFSISPFNEYSGLISFRMDFLELLAVQGTLKSLLQHRSSKASILWCSAFFMVQLLHP